MTQPSKYSLDLARRFRWLSEGGHPMIGRYAMMALRL